MTYPAVCISINGIVQGVGFRPTVWRLAHKYDLKGQIINDGQGVTILVQATEDQIHNFLQELTEHPPKLAVINHVDQQEVSVDKPFEAFTIEASQQTEIETTFVTDAATCHECIDDILDQKNRRYQYPFTNCTHCGPRYSIIKKLPYDRPYTSMHSFPMCPLCQKEYDVPDNRRFHAQPNACPECGPKIWLAKGDQALDVDNPLKKTIELIKSGNIIAVKGIGGYQLVCDAMNSDTIARLRDNKNRPAKPFALMAKSINMIKRYCHVSNVEAAQLSSTEAPIVLLKKSSDELPENVAPGLTELGFVLPYSPLHHLLMQRMETPVIFTSGNPHNAPQCVDNNFAVEQLGNFVDYFLHHDRDIVNRVDDSVLKIINDKPYMFRPGRGHAPALWHFSEAFETDKPIMAMGSQLKNTFSLAKKDRLISSQYIGQLENVQCYADYQTQLTRLSQLLDIKPEIIVVDEHPNYMASTYGKQLASEIQAEVIEVQHHHAHLAACLFDNGHKPQAGKVIGVVLDGLGYGPDGTLWGGEFMVADYQSYERTGHFKTIPMAGATKAILEPWRLLLAHLQQADFDKQVINEILPGYPVDTIISMIKGKINSPLTSSCGRLFDAVAAAIGICTDKISYDAQAAIELQHKAELANENKTYYSFKLDTVGNKFEINPVSMWQELINDLEALSAEVIAHKFHLGLAKIITEACEYMRSHNQISTVALCGGVYQNTLLLSLCLNALKQSGFNVMHHQNLTPNDSCLSVGQACIAASRIKEQQKSDN